MNSNSLEQVISDAQLNAQSLLTEFALSEDFLAQIQTAFGNDISHPELQLLSQQWLDGDFDSFPEIEIRSASDINGANGAFSIDTNKIYLAREFLNSSNVEAITSVLLEEYGHFVDRRINEVDAAGDEGDIFSRLVRGEELSDSELQQLKSEDDSSVITVDEENVAIEQASNNFKQVVRDGLNQTFDKIEQQVVERVFNEASHLPFIGNKLTNSDKFKFRDSFRDAISSAINSIDSLTVDTIETAEQALFDALGTDGSNLLQDLNGNGLGVDDIKITIDGNKCEFEFKLADSLDIFQTELGEHFGLPKELCLELFGANAKANVKLDYELYLKFGVDFNEATGSPSFYWDTNPTDSEEFKLGFNITLPELANSDNGELFEGKFGFFDLKVTDNDSSFEGSFDINLRDENENDNNDLLEDGEELSLDSKITGFADINLGFDAKISDSINPDSVEFPEFKTDFNFEWKFNNSSITPDNTDDPNNPDDLSNFGDKPKVYFDNVKLDLGSFFNFAKPILGKIQKITEPVADIIDLLNRKYDIGKVKLPSILEIAELASKIGDSEFPLSSEEIDFIKGFGDIIEFIDNFSFNSDGTLNLGDFDFGDSDIRERGFDLGAVGIRELGNLDLSQLDNLSQIEIPDEIPEFDPLAGLSEGSDQAANFYNEIPSFEGGSFKFPIFDDPTQAFNLLIGNIGDEGENVNFFNFNFPEIKFKAGYSEFFPIVGPLGARVGGFVGAEINLGFGYDAFGLVGFNKSTPEPSTINIPNGFYIEDFDENGNERSEVILTAGLEASAELNAGVASAGVGGGVYGNINFDLYDPNNDGRIRQDEFVGLLENPECLFETSGELTAGLRAYLKIGRGWFSRKKEYNSPRITLASFDQPHNCSTPDNAVSPILATNTGNSIQLNTGANAIAQLGVTTGSIGVVTPIPGSEVINQWGRQYGTSEYEGLLDVSLDNLGNVYVTGITSVGDGSDGSDVWVAKYDNNGNLQEVYHLGFFDNQVTDAKVDADGNVYLIGISSITVAAGGGIGVVINPDGSISSDEGFF